MLLQRDENENLVLVDTVAWPIVRLQEPVSRIFVPNATKLNDGRAILKSTWSTGPKSMQLAVSVHEFISDIRSCNQAT